MQKKCFRCRLAKDISLFHKDSTAKDGYSSSCKSCRNARRRNGPAVAVQDTTKEVTRVPVSLEGQENPYKKLSEKHGSFYTICVESSGKCQLQVFKGKPIILRGKNFDVEGLLSKLAR